MPRTDANIDACYRELLDALTPADRVAKSAAMFAWTREQIARQIVSERGPVDTETLKWMVALRLYGHEQSIRELIQDQFPDVPG
jgi:hypothetical protein